MQKITQAVILAGGKGQRLEPFTLNNPKPLIPINGKPFLDHLIQLLKENGIKEVILLTGYQSDKIKAHFHKNPDNKVKIKFSYTPLFNKKNVENESGLRLKNAEKLLNDTFLLLYCDNYWPLNLKKLTYFLQNHPADVLVSVYSNQDRYTKNNIFVSPSGFISKYDPTRQDKSLNGVDIGFFIINKKVLNLLPKDNSKFESIILPDLIKRKRLAGYLTAQRYYSIGDMQRVKLTEKFLSTKKIIFLDRDGVINKKAPKADYVKSWEEFEFLPNSIQAIKILNDNGYKVYIISNQAGIARGFLSQKDLNLIHKKMLKELNDNGTKIDGIYVCTHGWEEGCECRKPKPGLLLQASRDHQIDLTKAIFIGDDTRDKQTGQAVGCKTFLVSPRKSLFQLVKEII